MRNSLTALTAEQKEIAEQYGYCPMFAEFDSVNSAYDRAMEIAEHSHSPAGAVTAMGIVINALSVEIAKIKTKSK